jgi:hypothetical protein
MAKYKLELVDLEGDKLTVDIDDGKLSMKGSKFDMTVNPLDLKNLADLTVSVGTMITDFKLKSISVEAV